MSMSTWAEKEIEIAYAKERAASENLNEWEPMSRELMAKIDFLAHTEGIPEQFEYAHDITGERIYVRVIEYHRHHYTNELVFLIAAEGETGWIKYGYYTKATMDVMLETRTEDNK